MSVMTHLFYIAPIEFLLFQILNKLSKFNDIKHKTSPVSEYVIIIWQSIQQHHLLFVFIQYLEDYFISDWGGPVFSNYSPRKWLHNSMRLLCLRVSQPCLSGAASAQTHLCSPSPPSWPPAARSCGGSPALSAAAWSDHLWCPAQAPAHRSGHPSAAAPRSSAAEPAGGPSGCPCSWTRPPCGGEARMCWRTKRSENWGEMFFIFY